MKNEQDNFNMDIKSPVIKTLKSSNKKNKILIGLTAITLISIVGIGAAKVTHNTKSHKSDEPKQTNNDEKIEKINTSDTRNFDEENAQKQQETPTIADDKLIEDSQITSNSNIDNTIKNVNFNDLQYSSLACETCQNKNTNSESQIQENAQNADNQNITNVSNSNNQNTQNIAKFQAQKAVLIKNQDFILAMGTSAPLVLKTRIDSTLKGMVIAELLEDIPSMTGNINLLDKGSKFIGHIDKSIEEGAERLSVVWDRITTTQGIVVNINSLATDSLGGSGLNGHVNHQYTKRFGGAVALSLISDVVAAQVAKGNITNNIQNTQQQTLGIAEQILNSSINIKPILYKNQGEIINVLISEDLDFTDVYKLTLKGNL